MNVVLFGVDQSTQSIAVTMTCGDITKMYKRLLPKADLPAQCHEARRWMFAMVRNFKKEEYEVAVFVEQPLVGRSVKSSLLVATVQGGLIAGAYEAKADVLQTVHVSTWRSKIGAGRNKAQTKAWLRDTWPYAYKMAAGDHDLIDSAGINRYGSLTMRLGQDFVGGREWQPLRKSSKPRNRTSPVSKF